MTTKPQPSSASPVTAPVNSVVAEPAGTIRLTLAPLGIDYRADDFPVRFIEFCKQNDWYNMEVNAAGELLILPMTGYRGNKQANYLNHFLVQWELANGGSASSQTVRFRLPSGEIPSPDAAWISQDRFEALTEDEWNCVVDGAPDFVAELRSRTDDLLPMQNKLALWMEGGSRLGWLIDTRNRRVYVYRAGQPEPQILEDPERLHGEDVLAGFAFPVGQYIFDLERPARCL